MDRPRSRPDPGSLEEGPGRVKPEVESRNAPPDPGRRSAAPISGASYWNSIQLTLLLSDEDRLKPARAPLIACGSAAALSAARCNRLLGRLDYGPTHKFGTVSRSKRCGDATAEDG